MPCPGDRQRQFPRGAPVASKDKGSSEIRSTVASFRIGESEVERMADDFKTNVFLNREKTDKPSGWRPEEGLWSEGLHVLLNEWVIQLGRDTCLAIEHRPEASRTLVLCLSPPALGAGGVGLERRTACFATLRTPNAASSRSCRQVNSHARRERLVLGLWS